MSLSTRVRALRIAAGSRNDLLRKAGDALSTGRTMLDKVERDARFARLAAAGQTGQTGQQPTDWQMVVAAHHMLISYILPSNVQFYKAYNLPHWWTQLIRFSDEPSAMMDPIGLSISRDMIVSHLVQVVHTSAGYDVALLLMFDDGLDELRRQLELLCSGDHPRQSAIDAIIERADYHARLLAALDRFEADRSAQWRVNTYDAPEGCGHLFDWGIETFGSPGRLFDYARTLPQTPAQTLGAWLQGTLTLPSPAPAAPDQS